MNSRFLLLAALVTAGSLSAQSSPNASLTGNYFFRHVLLVSDGGTGISDTRTGAGTIIFSGTGTYTYTGQLLVGTAAPVAISGAGTYSVKPGGVTTLSNPIRSGATINARLGAGALVGASTEAGSTVFDVFIAIPVSTTALTNATLTGPYLVSSLEFPNGGTTNVRETAFKITANGTGSVAESSVTGQARNLGNHRTTQAISPITYVVSPDATGVLNFPTTSGLDQTTQLIAGSKIIYISLDGSYFIGGSLTAGAHGMIVGVKAFSSPAATNASFSGFYFNSELRFDADRSRLSATVGSVNATSVGAAWGRRVRQSDGLFDAATVSTYSIQADGSGSITSAPGQIDVAAGGTRFLTSGLDVLDTNSYELSFGARMPTQSGTGVFIDPQRVLNAANFTLGYPVSPGGFITLFGTGLATQTTTAKTFPFPLTLGNVTATVNGKGAPIYSVSPTQISLVVPYSSIGSIATIVVTANGVQSNSVDVPLSPTAPGLFSLTQNGLGSGAVLHANFSAVTSDNPAKPGEVVLVFLTGLGAVSPAVADGAAAPGAEPFARVIAPVAVTIGGLSAQVAYNGLAPQLASLYQLNVTVPLGLSAGDQSLAVQTLDGFTDMASIRVGAN